MDNERNNPSVCLRQTAPFTQGSHDQAATRTKNRIASQRSDGAGEECPTGRFEQSGIRDDEREPMTGHKVKTEKMSYTERLSKNIAFLCRTRGVDEDTLDMRGIDTFEGIVRNWAIEALCDAAEYFDVPVELLLYADLEKMSDPQQEQPEMEDNRLIEDHLMQAIETVGEMCESCTLSGDTDGFLRAAQVLSELVMARSDHRAETYCSEE